MAEEIRFPRLGWSMEEGKFIQWLKRDGEHVREGEPLFEMEGEKALQEIESVGNGILKIAEDAPAKDEVVQVGRLLGYLLLPNELLPTELLPEPNKDQPAHAGGNTFQADTKANDLLASQIVHPINIAEEPNTDDEAEIQPLVSSPRARRLAESLGLDWQAIPGTGRNGRVRESDVRQFAERQAAKHDSALSTSSNLFTPRRKMIAERLRRSRELTIPVTLTTKVDVSRLVTYRELQKKMQSLRVPAFTDLFAKHVAIVLSRHPAMAVRWNEDHTFLSAVQPSAFHIGIAVDTKEGLLVPVLREVYTKSIDDVVRESKLLIEKARVGRLSKDEMKDGVISITNLGSYGIDAFTPILNVPEIAILGLGAIRREPMLDDKGQVLTKDIMVLSLTFDHAAVDGAPAAAFLKDLVSEIEGMSSSV